MRIDRPYDTVERRNYHVPALLSIPHCTAKTQGRLGVAVRCLGHVAHVKRSHGIPEPVVGLTEVSRRPGLVSTEDFLVMLDAMDIETGIDIDKILELGRMVERIVDRQLWSLCLGTGERPGSRRVPKMQEYTTEKR